MGKNSRKIERAYAALGMIPEGATVSGGNGMTYFYKRGRWWFRGVAKSNHALGVSSSQSTVTALYEIELQRKQRKGK